MMLKDLDFLWNGLVKVIPETRRAQYILLLRFYLFIYKYNVYLSW